jgi:hypothetical protein
MHIDIYEFDLKLRSNLCLLAPSLLLVRSPVIKTPHPLRICSIRVDYYIVAKWLGRTHPRHSVVVLRKRFGKWDNDSMETKKNGPENVNPCMSGTKRAPVLVNRVKDPQRMQCRILPR